MGHSTNSTDTPATSQPADTCPMVWPVGIVRGEWVHQPCGDPTEPGQRYCTWCGSQPEAGQR
jgi:hypothetical protein